MAFGDAFDDGHGYYPGCCGSDDESGRAMSLNVTKWQDDGAACGRPDAIILQESTGEIEPWYFLVPACAAMDDAEDVPIGCCSYFQSVANGNGHDRHWHRLDPIRKPCTFHSVSQVES